MYKMAEAGCLRDASVQNLEVSGDLVHTGISNYMRFLTGDYFGLTVFEKADADTDTGFTMAANAVTNSVWDGAGAAAAMVLPKAVKDTIVVFRFSAAADGGQNITFTTGSGDTYEAFSIQPPIIGGADLVGNKGARCLPTPTYTTATSLVSAAAANNTLIIASTASNNQTNLGAELVWYCKTDGEWIMAFVPCFLGTGVINATFAFSTA